MNTPALRASSAIRVLSPRIEPPVREEVGSTASTHTRLPASTKRRPSCSISVDLPAPGGPVIPILVAGPDAA